MTLAHSKGQGQDYANFDIENLANCDRINIAIVFNFISKILKESRKLNK